MENWLDALMVDPLPSLFASGDEALAFFVRRDLLGEEPESAASLWETPAATKVTSKQQVNGAWRYRGQGREAFPYNNYDLIETYRNLRLLIEMYGFDRSHSAIQQAVDYVFSCQTEEGDIRGIIGNQYMPYYHGAITELLVKAGYGDDARIAKGFEWLLSMRQNDGGWIIPAQALPAKEKTEELWRGEPIPPDQARPFAHLATGMVLRAFAAHTQYRQSEEGRAAGDLLKSRFFQADKYNDRRSPQYWVRFQYPFWWTNILTALDSLSLMGYSADDEDIRRGLGWFSQNQEADGLWPTGYGKGKKAREARAWVGLAVCRVLKRLCPD